MMENYGILSIIPSASVLALALYFKKSIEPLVIGVVIGFLLLDGYNCVGGIVDGINTVFQGDTLSMIVPVTLFFGIFIELLEKSDSALAFSNSIGKHVNSDKSSLLVTWIIGILIFIDDFLNAIVVGTTMKKITDKYNVPREMLAFVVDATSAPMAVLLPFSAWSVFFMSMFSDLGLLNYTGLTAFSMYCKTIPYIFYALIAVCMVPLVIFGIIPHLGQMKDAYKNMNLDEKKEYKVDKINKNARAYHFFVPILILIISTLLCGGEVIQGVIISIIFTIILYRTQNLVSNVEIYSAIKNGVVNMIPVTGIIFFSLLLVESNVRLGTTSYIINAVSPFMSKSLLPFVSFSVVAILAFSTGSFFGTTAIIMPIVIPMSLVCGCNLYLVLGSIISGAVFGSHCCFFGDASVLTSASCEITPLRHGITQLPYGLIAYFVSSLIYIILGIVS